MLAPDLVDNLRGRKPMLWLNPGSRSRDDPFSPELVDTAEHRLLRAGPLLARVLPELAGSDGLIESPLIDAQALRDALGGQSRWLLKADNRLPVAGSVKARGGFHEVLEFAEQVALRHGWDGDDFAALAEPCWRECFATYQLVVGSTGNLGISIGLLSRALGFRAQVHMSDDAKQWKKRLLREQGVCVIEHAGDYAKAVAAGRAVAEADPQAHFVDDERSLSLFAGYAVAGRRMAAQLKEQGISVSASNPLLVYLPCGVGGAPGGITYGLKQMFGGHVHCFFAEPVESPSVLVQLASGLLNPVSVHDVGLSNRTLADGLAVGQASMLASACMQDRLAGVFTVPDASLSYYLELAWEKLGERVEPSATAAFAGPGWISGSQAGAQWCARHQIDPSRATHVLWCTGGSLVPDSEFQQWLS
ncbi:D-serine ammonia-lyase [Halopseudomonas pelagia]|uniref:D-serine ammonia-lyase n=1 Tax=Halopseudomonas pelagia TaxID=553151 RepID=UPI0003A12EEC|nr:D-serine ammonia-lyase [Halopseudomonas pelagia]|tara:strand:- start:161195 stop:162448 length:1254 start_codon:yes stop_codon:yes gene_type:complete